MSVISVGKFQLVVSSFMARSNNILKDKPKHIKNV